MTVARAHGINLSAFRAWPEADQRLALALHIYETTLCPDCGNPQHEAMDPATAGKWKVPPPVRCHACTALLREVDGDKYAKASQPRALHFRAELPTSGS